VHDPLQQAWHLAMQVADGGVPLHCPLQVAEQLA
jgi:hypothetical protein